MSAQFESIEARRLLSASPITAAAPALSLNHGVLNVSGTAKDDHIVVARVSGTQINVSTSGTKAISILGEDLLKVVNVKVQVVKGKGGGAVSSIISDATLPTGPMLRVDIGTNEYFVPAASVKSVHVDAGAGDDYVDVAKSVALPATLIGARGDDTLAGSTKHDSLSGGAGNDVLFGGAGTAQDDFDTSSGHDTVVKNPAPTPDQPSDGTTTIVGDVDKLTDIIFKDGIAYI